VADDTGGVGMTRWEAWNDIRETWEKYKKIDHPEYTTSELLIAEELLDDIERLIEP